MHETLTNAITPEVSSAISRRNILFRKFKRNPSDDNWNQFKKQRNLVTTLKRNSMKSYFVQASAECTHPGEFWKKFKPLLPSKSTQQQQIQLMEEGRLITDNVEIANIFNKHFTHGIAAHIPILPEHAFTLVSTKLVIDVIICNFPSTKLKWATSRNC